MGRPAYTSYQMKDVAKTQRSAGPPSQVGGWEQVTRKDPETLTEPEVTVSPSTDIDSSVSWVPRDIAKNISTNGLGQLRLP